jgi:hypothetical protein
MKQVLSVYRANKQAQEQKEKQQRAIVIVVFFVLPIILALVNMN